MTQPTRTLALAAALASQALWGVLPVFSAPAAPALDQRVRETERKQQLIRTSTQHIGEDLAAIITEFENNGMGDGEDVKVLRAIKGVLGKLSDKEMARVIELLGAARGGNDAAQNKSKVAQPFAETKPIVVELRQLLLEYERQQELYEFSLRFAQLANRQNGNLKEAKRLVRSAQGRGLDRFDENQKISLSVQKDEQTAIRDEAMGVINKLGNLAKDTESTTAERLTQSLQAAQKGKVEDALRNAVEELKAANLYRAAGSQKQARDQLRDLSRLVAPPKDAQEILRQAAAELERLIIEQKQTIAQTQALADAARKNEEAYFEAEDRQGDVVDRTDMVQKDIEHVCPLASDQCKKAEDRMQDARSNILEKRRDEATKNQEQAVVHLAAAQKLVLEELNKQEKKEERAVDKLAEAKALKEKVTALKEEQEKLKKETQATKDQPKKVDKNDKSNKLADISPQQAKLQADARDLQPETAQASVPAADAIAEAAKEMGKAQAAIDKAVEKKDNKLEQATAPQQAAVENLARAEKLLDKEIANLEQAKNDLDQLEKAREKVAELIKNENKIEIATAKAEAMQKPDAAKPDPKEKKAPTNGEKAKNAIEKKIGNPKNQLAKPAAAKAAANADLAQAIAKAQADIGQAMQQADAGKPAAADKPAGDK